MRMRYIIYTVMASTYLLYVAAFGAATVFFLWLRDARIFYRTGYPGYRTAAYRGVLYSAIALFGFNLAYYGEEFFGLLVILVALYLQGMVKKEKVWSGETTLERLFGSVRRRNDMDTK
jgi:hypothetical protein